MRACALLTIAVLALLPACSDDPAPSDADTALDTSADVDPDAAPDVVTDAAADTEPDAALDPAPDGTTAVFDLQAARTGSGPEAFFAFPFPSDLRLDADGTQPMHALPNPLNVGLLTSLIEGADDLRGASQMPVGWFRFDAALAPVTEDETIAPDVDAGAFLVNLDAESPRYLELAPLVARTLTPDPYVPEHTLAVGVYPGWVLDPATTYGLVLTRSWGDAAGAELGVPDGLWALAHGADAGSTELSDAYAPLWPALDELGVDRASVAAATVFTTGDVVADVWAFTEELRQRYGLTLENLRVDPEDGAAHPRFCELLAEVTVPEFQTGEPPYDTDGVFVFDDDGVPIEQFETTIPVVLTLPIGEMPPDGFPLAMYFHGSGGLSSQVVDRGPDGTTGEGPAHVLAGRGIAALGSAHPLNPERLRGASSFAYLNLANLKSFRDTFRQGIIEQRLLLDAVLSLRIDPAVVAACEGMSLPAGADAYVLDPQPVLAMGQSMGGMFANIMAPVEPRIEAVVPTGAGGFWSFFILHTNLVPGAGALIGNILQLGDATHMHPALHTLQLAWEPVEAFVYVPRLAADPLPGHPVRSIYEPVGEGDSYFPTLVYDRIALAYRNQQAGSIVWPSTQDALQWRELDGLADYPVVNNRRSMDGRGYTGVVVQYPGDGVHDPHEIFQFDDRVKHQYACFFATYLADGIAAAPAAAGADDACTP